MKVYRFSIIIPHKNIPELLIRCINSVPKRDDIQIIVVDDNSKDADTYINKYPILSRPNIEFYSSKEGKGAGFVRNIGLDHAKGEWLLFSDADDIFTDRFDEILKIIEADTESDIIYFDVESRDSDTFAVTNESEWISNKIKDLAHNGVTDQNKYGMLTPWSKAISHQLVKEHHIRFEVVPCSNDTAFSTFANFYAKKVRALTIPGYCWMQRQGSLWRTKDYSWYIIRMEVLARLACFMKEHDDKAGYEYFSVSAQKFMNDLAKISKIQHVKANFKYGMIMKDYGVIFKHIPYLILHYARIL